MYSFETKLRVRYGETDQMGFALPVVNFNVNYKKPALYDDELTVKTTIKAMPSAKIIFDYETFNAAGDLLNTGEVVLVFVNKDTGKPCFAPEIIMNRFKEKLV